jgi:hypothetical protein
MRAFTRHKRASTGTLHGLGCGAGAENFRKPSVEMHNSCG